MERKCGKSLKYSIWTPKNAKLARQWFHSVCSSYKKIMFKQRIYLNYLSKFKRFPLETTNVHRRWLDLWKLYMAIISKPFQIFTTALWCQFIAPCQFSSFSDLYSISLFSKTQKIHLYGVPKQFFHTLRCLFSCIRHPHVEKTARQIFVTVFVIVFVL